MHGLLANRSLRVRPVLVRHATQRNATTQPWGMPSSPGPKVPRVAVGSCILRPGGIVSIAHHLHVWHGEHYPEIRSILFELIFSSVLLICGEGQATALEGVRHHTLCFSHHVLIAPREGRGATAPISSKESRPQIPESRFFRFRTSPSPTELRSGQDTCCPHESLSS